MDTVQEISEKSALILSPTSSNSNGAKLRKSLGCIQAFAYIVGILFGGGLFISPSLVARETSNMGMALVVWVISAMPCLFGALCFCELATMLKKTGGEYIFIKEAFGNVPAFVTVWAQTFIIFPAGKAILAITIGEYLLAPFYDIESTTGLWITKFIAIFSMLIVVITNLVSTSFVGRTQIFFTVVQTTAVLFLVVLGLWKVSTGHTSNYKHMFANTTRDFNFGSFSIALYDSLLAYDGWGLISCITEELHNLERDLWLSVVTGIPFVMLCYVLVNLAFMSALTRDEIASSATVATTFVQNIFGKKVAMIMPPAIALSCFCCMNGAAFMECRVMLSAAREGQLPEPLSYIHRDKRIPIPATIFLFILTTLWILPMGTGIQALITSYSYAVWLTYALAIISVLVLRVRRPNAPRPFKVWIANPIFTGVIAVILVIAPFVKQPIESSFTLAFIVSSLPAYYFLIYKHDSLPERFISCKKSIYRFILDHASLVPCIFDDDKETEGIDNDL
eukprot:Seg2103.4 transcript_id=Seg2103.4/GoldUCD/mRNA.D3Y31 product="Glycoprotein-associated amino acid transporter b0,+AT1" protein_id=Seg2103.4/GoldUCD/D3Y31